MESSGATCGYAVGQERRHAAFRVQAIEVAKKEGAEALSRGQIWPSRLLGIERWALRLDEVVEPVLDQRPI